MTRPTMKSLKELKDSLAVPEWMRSERDQSFRSTNDEKNQRVPVVFFGLYQKQEEAHQIRDIWKAIPDKKLYRVRCFERQVRVDTILTSVFVTVVRRRDQLDLELPEGDDSQASLETQMSPTEDSVESSIGPEDMPF